MQEEKTPEQLYEEKYPQKDFNKKTFSFTPSELRELQSFDTISKLGQMAIVMANNFAISCLKRVNIKQSPDTGLLYSVEKGEFYTYEPKLWCSECNLRRATYQYDNKIYCGNCIDPIRDKIKTEKKEEETVKKEKTTKAKETIKDNK